MTVKQLDATTKEEILEAAAHWRTLAQEERNTGDYEVKAGISDGKVHRNRASLYDEVAVTLDIQARTGIGVQPFNHKPYGEGFTFQQ